MLAFHISHPIGETTGKSLTFVIVNMGVGRPGDERMCCSRIAQGVMGNDDTTENLYETGFLRRVVCCELIH